MAEEKKKLIYNGLEIIKVNNFPNNGNKAECAYKKEGENGIGITMIPKKFLEENGIKGVGEI